MALLGNRRREEMRETSGPGRVFHIVSEMKDKKVLDVDRCNPEPNTPVIIYDRKSEICNNQLWFMDEAGILHSKLNGFVIDTTSGQARLQPRMAGNPNQEWAFSGNKIINRSRPGECLDIYKAKDKNGEKVIPYNYHGANNEHWFIEYCD